MKSRLKEKIKEKKAWLNEAVKRLFPGTSNQRWPRPALQPIRPQKNYKQP